MTNAILTNVSCPNCLNPIDVREHGRHVSCNACNSQYILRGHLCPNCSSYNDEEASLCGNCATPLTRICRKCKTSNWAGDEYCLNCNNAMDILDLIAGNYLMKTSERLLDQRMQAQQLQADEEIASKRRMDELIAIEKKDRQQEIQRRLVKQKQQERSTVIVLGVIGVIFILIVIVFSLFSLL